MTSAWRPTFSGSARMILPSAAPTGSSAVAWLLSRTAMNRPSASAAPNPRRRHPQPAANRVASVRSPGRIHRDAGLAQDRDVAARGPLGHLQLRRELAAGDAGLVLQQLEGPQGPPGGAQVGVHTSQANQEADRPERRLSSG